MSAVDSFEVGLAFWTMVTDMTEIEKGIAEFAGVLMRKLQHKMLHLQVAGPWACFDLLRRFLSFLNSNLSELPKRDYGRK